MSFLFFPAWVWCSTLRPFGPPEVHYNNFSRELEKITCLQLIENVIVITWKNFSRHIIFYLAVNIQYMYFLCYRGAMWLIFFFHVVIKNKSLFCGRLVFTSSVQCNIYHWWQNGGYIISDRMLNPSKKVRVIIS